MKRLLTVVGSVGGIHGLEDVGLLTMGRFLPVPVWAMYAIGLGVSTTIMTFLVNHLTNNSKNEKS